MTVLLEYAADADPEMLYAPIAWEMMGKCL